MLWSFDHTSIFHWLEEECGKKTKTSVRLREYNEDQAYWVGGEMKNDRWLCLSYEGNPSGVAAGQITFARHMRDLRWAWGFFRFRKSLNLTQSFRFDAGKRFGCILQVSGIQITSGGGLGPICTPTKKKGKSQIGMGCKINAEVNATLGKFMTTGFGGLASGYDQCTKSEKY